MISQDQKQKQQKFCFLKEKYHLFVVDNLQPASFSWLLLLLLLPSIIATFNGSFSPPFFPRNFCVWALTHARQNPLFSTLVMTLVELIIGNLPMVRGHPMCLKIPRRNLTFVVTSRLLWKPLVILFCPLKILSDSWWFFYTINTQNL